MKLLSLLLISFSLLCASLSAAEYGFLTIADQEGLVLNAGDLIEFLGGDDNKDSNAIIIRLSTGVNVTIDGSNLGLSRYGNTNGLTHLGTDSSKSFVGPCTITTSLNYIAYKLTRASEIAQSSTPVNTVVIPTDANGDVEIILESSVDLVNWTAATPGQYSAATENRFFRIRAVETGN
jgi:hypothetical protein